MYRLLAGRWNLAGTYKYTDSAMLEPEAAGVNWRVDGFGVQRIEVTVRARNKYDQYDRYQNHLGQRLAIYGSDCYRPISGYITDVEYAGAGRVTYTAKGPGAARMADELDTTIYSTSSTLDAVIKAMLTAHVSVSASDQSNIAANATTVGGWQPKYPEGSYPADIIADLLKMSDASGNIWDFWFLDRPFSGVALQTYLPYYQHRAAPSLPDWVVYSRDLTRSTVARDINDIVTSATVYYGTITGTHTAGTQTTVLQDSTKDFRALGVQPGDQIVNITDGSRTRVIDHHDTLTNTVKISGLTGGTDNDFDGSDAYAMELQNPLSTQTGSATATYWSRAVAEYQSKMTSTQAGQYAGILADTSPRQVQAFTVGAPTIRTGSGARVPLWEVVAQGGGYIRWADMYPAAAQFTNALDNSTTFFITGLDYDYTSNQLAVTVDHPAMRLDSRLRRAGILGSDMVQRGGGAAR